MNNTDLAEVSWEIDMTIPLFGHCQKFLIHSSTNKLLFTNSQNPLRQLTQNLTSSIYQTKPGTPMAT